MSKFNEAHGQQNYFEKSQSLVFLVNKAIEITGQRIDEALEVGCGQGLNLCNFKTLGIDLSSAAIAKAQDNFPEHQFKVLSSLSLRELGTKYSLILDAHQIHYLKSKEEIGMYLREVFAVLEDGGVFCMEAMVAHKELAIGDLDVTILDSIEYEKLLNEAGLSIKYLMLPRGRKFIADKKRRAAIASDPDVLLVIATKEGVAKKY